MLRVWKYGLKVTDRQVLSLPKGAKILAVQTQGSFPEPQLWALVDPEADAEKRHIYTFGTGHEVRLAGGYPVYLGTYQSVDGSLVFHVFEAVTLELG